MGTSLNSSLSTLTRVETEPASRAPRLTPPSRPHPTPTSPATASVPSLLPSLRDLPLSPSRLTNPPSRPTNPESFPALPVEPTLTTVSSPSDTVPSLAKTTTSLRTPGVPAGDLRDTSRSEGRTELVSAVSRKTPSVPPPTEDCSSTYSISILIIFTTSI